MNSPLTVQDVFTLSWGSSVPSVTGLIDVLHPQMGGSGWSLQNGKLRDPRTGATIEFMLSKFQTYWNPRDAIGQRVTLISTRPDDMIWKGQKAKANVNGGEPFAKLEISPTVQMSWPEKDDPLFNLTAPGAPSRPVPTPAIPKVEARAPKTDVRLELRQMMALYAVAGREASKSPFVADNGRDAVHLQVFQSAVAQGLHRQLDVDEIAIELDPTAAERLHPNLTALAKQFEGREGMLNMLLRGSGLLTMGQTWKDISEEQAANVLENPEIKQFLATAS